MTVTDAQFLERTREHLGSKEHWCQSSFGIRKLSIDGGDTMTCEVSLFGPPNPRDLANYERLTQLCLDTAIMITDQELYLAEKGRAWHELPTTVNSAQASRVRAELTRTFAEQFPEIWKRLNEPQPLVIAFSPQGNVMSEMRKPLFEKPEQTEIPKWNDAEEMTYEGLVSVIEKTMSKLEEQS